MIITFGYNTKSLKETLLGQTIRAFSPWTLGEAHPPPARFTDYKALTTMLSLIQNL